MSGEEQEVPARRSARSSGRSRRKGVREPVAENVDLGKDLRIHTEGGGEEWPGSIDDVPRCFHVGSSGGAADAVAVADPALAAANGDRKGSAGDGNDANGEVPAGGGEEAIKNAPSTCHREDDGSGE